MKNAISKFFIVLFANISLQTIASDIYCVALAGGAGERLWPLSRKNHPKQFLSINGKQTLLEDTLDRLGAISSSIHPWIVTTKHYKDKILEYIDTKVEKIVIEPHAQNTGPAILLTALLIAHENPEACLVLCPTDHYIDDTQAFAQALQCSVEHAKKSDAIVLLGVKPTFPATGYGYIACDQQNQNGIVVPVLAFHEKPNHEKAQEFLNAGNFLWNAGIFCGSVKTFIRAFKLHAPDLYYGMLKYLAGERDYETLPKISFDYAVLEKYASILVHPVSFEWSDIGDMKTFLTIQEKNSPNKNIIEINANENLVSTTKKLVALVDVNNLCVVENEGILLIIPQDSVQKIRNVVDMLKNDVSLNIYRW